MAAALGRRRVPRVGPCSADDVLPRSFDHGSAYTPGRMPRPAPDKNSSHLADEYFVAAELYRLGYSVAMTLGNAKAIDLFVEHETQTVNVQVKAIRDKKSIGWPLMKDEVVDGVVYVFVCLNAPGLSPDY